MYRAELISLFFGVGYMHNRIKKGYVTNFAGFYRKFKRLKYC